MIKINLLSEGKRPAAVRRTRPTTFLESENIALWAMLAAILLLGALPAFGWWWATSDQVEENDQRIAEAQRQVDELAAIIAEVEGFKAKQAELEHKIDVIEQLRQNQKGPVRVMDQISRALPELLWVDRMNVGPSSITLTGRAFNSNAVANFIENLDRVPEFEEPVLRDLAQSNNVYTYTVVFNYSYLRAAEEADGAAEQGTAGAAGDAAAAGG